MQLSFRANFGVCCYRLGATEPLFKDFSSPQTALVDLVHLPSIVNVLLDTLALSDLAHLAVSSKACAAALRPDKVKLHISRTLEVPALRCLFRLGCLDLLHEATLCVWHAYVHATAGSYLGILGMCPWLQQLSVDYTVSCRSLEKDESSFKGLLADLPMHLTRNVHLVGIDTPSAQPHQ